MRKAGILTALLLMAGTPALATQNSAPAPNGDGDSLTVAAIVFFLTAVAALFLGKKSDMMRDAQPTDFGMGDESYRRPYSLAQTQMTWWFCIILSSFVYIAISRLETPGAEILQALKNILTGQTLVLLGIGTGTALGAAIIEQSKDPSAKVARLAQVLAAIKAAGQNVPADLIAQRNALAGDLKSEGFFRDILTDVDGVSLHRFQSVAWTLVLGIFFIWEVIASNPKAMPEFDPYLLGVLGISGATYLGFKVPEQSS